MGPQGFSCCDGHSGLGGVRLKESGRVFLMVPHEVDGHQAAGDRQCSKIQEVAAVAKMLQDEGLQQPGMTR